VVRTVTTGPVTPDLPRAITRMVAMIRAPKFSTRLLSRRVFNMRVSQAQLRVPVKLFICRVLPTQKTGRDPNLLEITPNFNTAAGCAPTAGFRLVTRAAALEPDQGAPQVVVVLEDTPRSACDTGDRVLGQPDAHVDFPGEPLCQARKLRAAACHADAGLHEVGDQLRRRLLQGVFDRVDHDLNRGRERLTQLDGGHVYSVGQAGDQVAPAHRHGAFLGERVSRADLDLGALSHALAAQQVVLRPHVADDVLVHLIAGDANGPADGNAAH